MQNKDFPSLLPLLPWQAHFAARVCFSTCPDSQECHAGLAMLQSTLTHLLCHAWLLAAACPDSGWNRTRSPRSWERPGQPCAALPPLDAGQHLGCSSVCVGHAHPTVAQADMSFAGTEHLSAPGEMDSPQGSTAWECRLPLTGCGSIFCLLSMPFPFPKG